MTDTAPIETIPPRALAQVATLASPDMTTRQLALLDAITASPAPMTVRYLAAYLGVQKPVVTRSTNTLAVLGYVKREPDPRDGRSIYIVPTPEGRILMAKIDWVLAREHRDEAIAA